MSPGSNQTSTSVTSNSMLEATEMEHQPVEEPQDPAKDEKNSPAIKSEAPKSPQDSNIPNGGLEAWLQVAGSFFLFFNGWGIINSYGVFQTYYELNMLSHKSASQIAWIGSLQAFLLLFVGVLTGPLFDHGQFRLLISVGCFLGVFGMMMTSICKAYWQLMLAQALVVGVGSGCIFIPSVAILPTYFSTKKGLANGLAVSGSGFGGIIYPIIFRQLQPSIGFGWATRVIAFVMLATSFVPLSVMKMRVKPSLDKKKGIDASAWKELPYPLSVLSMFITLMGLYTPLFYVEVFAIEKHIMSASSAFYLLPIFNAGSVFGRILPNLIFHKIGALNMNITSTLACGILGFAWIAIHNTGGVVAFLALYGFTSGLWLTLPMMVVVALSPSLGVVGVRMGMAFSIGSFGVLIGQPIAGAIVKRSWTGLQVWTGATLVLGAAIMLASRVSKVGTRFAVKI